MTWWQTLLVFWIYGTGARVDQILSKDSDFGWFARMCINVPFSAAAYILVDVWAGITW